MFIYYFLGFHVYIFVDLVNYGVLTLVGEIPCYRNDCYSYQISSFGSIYFVPAVATDITSTKHWTVKVTSAEVFPFLVALHGALVVLDLLKQLPSLPAQNRGGLLPSHTSHPQAVKPTNGTSQSDISLPSCSMQVTNFFVKAHTEMLFSCNVPPALWAK